MFPMTVFKEKKAAMNTRMKPIQKITGPDPGSYKVQESIEKTQRLTKQWKLYRHERSTYIDHEQKKKKAVPGIGSYNEDSAYKMLSSPPMMLRRKR